MFLFSCTTSQEIKYVKQKVFEALYRADQLGGEHARVILVSTMYNRAFGRGTHFSQENNIEELDRDLSQFRARRNCELIGIDELYEETCGNSALTNKLKQIIG